MRELIYGVSPRSFAKRPEKAYRRISRAAKMFMPLGVDAVWFDLIREPDKSTEVWQLLANQEHGQLDGKLMFSMDYTIEKYSDLADGMYNSPARTHPFDLETWIEGLLWYDEDFSLGMQLESHDFPRSVSRFGADARTLAIFQFSWPADKVYLWMGQELGLENNTWLRQQDSIRVYRDDPLSTAVYDQLILTGAEKKDALDQVDKISRLHACTDWREIYNQDYRDQMRDPDSVWNLYRTLIDLWKTDPTLAEGDFILKYLKGNVLEYTRGTADDAWDVHLDFGEPERSFMHKKTGDIHIE